MCVTTAGVAIAVAALFSLWSFQRGYRMGMQAELNHLGAHVLVVPKGCPYDAASIALHGASWPCYLKADYLAEVRAVRPVGVATPVLMSALGGTNGEQMVYVGVEPSLLQLKPEWHLSGRFPGGSGELLIGATVQRRTGWQLGEAVELPGVAGEHGVVRGVLQATQSSDDDFIFLGLSDAQKIFRHPGELTHILVRLSDPDQLDAAVSQLRGCNAGMEMNVVPLEHLFRSIQALVNSTRVWLGCVGLVALLVAAAGVTNTMLMAVVERAREIGVMRAMGAARADIFWLFFLDALQICFLGGVAGEILAWAASHTLDAWVRTQLPLAPRLPMMHWEWPVALACLAAALILGSLAGCCGALRAAQLSPRTAMLSRGGAA